MQKNKIANYIIILAVISAILTLLLGQRFFSLGNGMFVASIGSSIAFLLALICVKKLRATPSTKKLYNVMILILIINIALSIFSIFFIQYASKHALLENFTARDTVLFNQFNTYYLYVIVLINIVLMVSIIFKEKKNINWMLLGKLTSSSFVILKFILFRLKINSSLLQMIGYSNIIGVASSLLWVAGAIIMAMQVKKHSESKQLDS